MLQISPKKHAGTPQCKINSQPHRLSSRLMLAKS